MLDLDPEVRVQLAVLVLMILATEMPAIAMFVLDKAEAGQQ
ncbi:MAG: hypothetical protein JWQ32_2054 [Marmoricola sp.]|nr:hypothetical protein [Marmoricola sp.]